MSRNPRALQARAHIKAVAGDDLLHTAGLEKRLEALRNELTGPEPSPLEILLADRICCCWLAVHQADMHESQLGSGTLAQGDYHQRRHDRAHRRFLTACKAFAQVRRLLGPSIQVNIGEKQINVTT